MRRSFHLCLLVPLLGAPLASACAQEPAPLYDPRQLPAFSGQVQLFTLTPRGDIDGFVLTDGTEVKTPPHLTAQLAAAIKPGDRVTIHGLKAASQPLVQAMSVMNDVTGRSVVDAGPDVRPPGQMAIPPPSAIEDAGRPPSVVVQGRVRMALHGPRGDINGVLLDDGSVLRLPPPEAARLANLFAPGQPLVAEGIRRATDAGSFVDLTAVGPARDRMTPLQPIGRPRPPV